MSTGTDDKCNPPGKSLEDVKKKYEDCKQQGDPRKRKYKDAPCADLEQDINDTINKERPKDPQTGKPQQTGKKGLKQRFEEQEKAREQAENGVKGGLCPPGTYAWYSHQLEIIEQQRNLKRLLDEYTNPNRKEKCDGDRVPNEVLGWLEKPAPNDSPVTSPSTGDEPAPRPVDLSPLGWVVGGGALLYATYRVVRFLPSLAPPLWPTIPANLAIP